MRFLYKLIAVVVGLPLFFIAFIPSVDDGVIAFVMIGCVMFLAYQDQRTKRLLADKTQNP